MEAAEQAILTLLTQPSIARAMGAAAALRARTMFAPKTIMDAHEVLFSELNEIRRCAPSDAYRVCPVSPQIDPVSVFEGFSSHPPLSFDRSVSSLDTLPDPVRQQRNPLWQINSAQPSALQTLERNLAFKHQQV